MYRSLLLAVLAVQSIAAPAPDVAITKPKQKTTAPLPQFKRATIIANVTQPSIDRDSCGSARIGNRAFWTCRDTMAYNVTLQEDVLPIAANTGGWTDLTPTGPLISNKGNTVGVASSGNNSIHLMYGTNPMNLQQPYFPFVSNECSSNGMCSDGSRWVQWPNQPPLITQSSSQSAVGYSFIAKEHISGLNLLTPQPAHVLYRINWSSSSPKTALPTVTVVNPHFWKSGEIGYGRYGSVIRNGYAYLYAQLPNNNGTALARVPTSSIENRSAYQYYVNSTWVSTTPKITSPNIVIPNAGTGWQGTFYWSTAFSCYIWIGQQAGSPSANFWITTALNPEGPWATPTLLWSGPNGDGWVGAYSLQAHPALLPSLTATEKAIYLSYTQQWAPQTLDTYVTPLVYLEFQ